ncbi:ABC transporter ATP-binding protein [Galactobacter valiniphilus]|uniref:ABC transporter ATP-binding protein n=1 Tax=Galactobacter valiniphilus TaxID=2676122 RepID=A0A399JEY3_9MICC|nr:ABC transporter ATP-binding protein [Galactobacter valiniphilus]RII42729.1 ABC transporter ATP-binding protein [Galactobacter valiniphilus]
MSIQAPEATALAVAAQNLTKTYGTGPTAVTALDDVSVGFERGKFTAIMGPSGSGKSTLMHCLATLDTPTSGALTLGGSRVDGLDDDALTTLRRDRVGFVFQAFNLVPTLSAEQNIVLPLELAGKKPDAAWMAELVERLGLGSRLKHKPHELSGGQQQRVAVARALLPRPDVVFGDEPTGNLDSSSGAEVLRLLQRSAHEDGQTVIMVTHDPVAAASADRVVLLKDGRLAGEIIAPQVEQVSSALARLGAAS